MAKHIGIVGCSAEGASLCYRTMCAEAESLMGKHAHPEVTLHTIALAEYVKHLEKDQDWDAIGELMLRSAATLHRAGADFIICPDNTIHQAMPYVLPRSPLPWLHIAEEVGKDAQRQGYKRVGLTGTKYLVDSQVYPEKLEALHISCIRPTPEQRLKINAIIFEELVRGIHSLESLFYFQQVLEQMKNQGCDAVILGCTEMPLLIGDDDSPLPTLDSSRALARAALREALL